MTEHTTENERSRFWRGIVIDLPIALAMWAGVDWIIFA